MKSTNQYWLGIVAVVFVSLLFGAVFPSRVNPQTARIGHTDEVDAIALSPDGKILASVGKNNAIKLWEAGTGKLQLSIDSMADEQNRLPVFIAHGLAFSPDGKILALGLGAKITLFDPRSGVKVAELADKDQGIINSLAFSPDSKLLAAGQEASSLYEAKSVVVWDVASKKKLHSLAGATGPVAFNRNGTLLATSGTSEWIQIWNPRTGKRIVAVKKQTEIKEYESVNSFSFNSIGNVLAAFTSHATGLAEYEVLFLNPLNGKLVKTAKPINVNHVGSFTVDGRTFLRDGIKETGLVLDNPISGKVISTIETCTGVDELKSLSANGRFAAFLDADKRHSVVCDLVSKKKTELTIGYSIDATSAAFSPDSRKFVAGYKSGNLLWWDVGTGKIDKEVRRMKDGKPEDFLVGGDEILVASDSRRFRPAYSSSVYSTTSGEQLFQLDTESSTDYSFSADGARLLGVNNETVTIRDADTGKVLQRFLQRASEDKDELKITSSFRNAIIVLGKERWISFWDSETGKKIKELPEIENGIKRFAFSPNGRFFAYSSGGFDKRRIDIIRYATQETILEIEEAYPYFAFSPDSSRIAVIDKYDSLRITSLSDAAAEPIVSEEEFAIEALSATGVSGIVYSPDGKKIAVYGSHGITIFDAATAEVIRRLK